MNNNYFKICIISINYLTVAPIIIIVHKKEGKGKKGKKKLWLLKTYQLQSFLKLIAAHGNTTFW